MISLPLGSCLASFESPHSAIVNVIHHELATWPFAVSSLDLASLPLFCLITCSSLGNFLVFAPLSSIYSQEQLFSPARSTNQHMPHERLD